MVIDFLCSWWLPVCVAPSTVLRVIMTNDKGRADENNDFETYQQKKAVFSLSPVDRKSLGPETRPFLHDQLSRSRSSISKVYRLFLLAVVSRERGSQVPFMFSKPGIRWCLPTREHLKLMAFRKYFFLSKMRLNRDPSPRRRFRLERFNRNEQHLRPFDGSSGGIWSSPRWMENPLSEATRGECLQRTFPEKGSKRLRIRAVIKLIDFSLRPCTSGEKWA